jgi:hypothetical protein
VVRPDDLLVLTFQFINLQLVKPDQDGEPAAYLKPGKSAYIAVYFQGQNIAEEAFFEGDNDFPPKAARIMIPTMARLLPSRSHRSARPLAPGASQPAGIQSTAGRTTIPYTLESLLECLSRFELSVASTALPPEPKLRFLLPAHIWVTLQQARLSNLFDNIANIRVSQPVVRQARDCRFPRKAVNAYGQPIEPGARTRSCASAILEKSHRQVRTASSVLTRLGVIIH